MLVRIDAQSSVLALECDNTTIGAQAKRGHDYRNRTDTVRAHIHQLDGAGGGVPQVNMGQPIAIGCERGFSAQESHIPSSLIKTREVAIRTLRSTADQRCCAALSIPQLNGRTVGRIGQEEGHKTTVAANIDSTRVKVRSHIRNPVGSDGVGGFSGHIVAENETSRGSAKRLIGNPLPVGAHRVISRNRRRINVVRVSTDPSCGTSHQITHIEFTNAADVAHKVGGSAIKSHVPPIDGGDRRYGRAPGRQRRAARATKLLGSRTRQRRHTKLQIAHKYIRDSIRVSWHQIIGGAVKRHIPAIRRDSRVVRIPVAYRPVRADADQRSGIIDNVPHEYFACRIGVSRDEIGSDAFKNRELAIARDGAGKRVAIASRRSGHVDADQHGSTRVAIAQKNIHVRQNGLLHRQPARPDDKIV